MARGQTAELLGENLVLDCLGLWILVARWMPKPLSVWIGPWKGRPHNFKSRLMKLDAGLDPYCQQPSQGWPIDGKDMYGIAMVSLLLEFRKAILAD